ncbi:hmg1/2-like protein [Phtheirospermum japonicum]|uniref:Hmg1/2-like protein n=1 Tax=Phtheirospermum japonicum TaxID=374723 RepID=A0A830CA77_9LAMI|nr:hmg1/2-like protein [Phtheirospermum japonicum]
MLFMAEFVKEYKEMQPDNKRGTTVGKAGGEWWKSMSELEKAPFIAKHQKGIEEYELAMKAYS